MFLSLMLMALPAGATSQYTEGTCLLLKKQVIDYKRRLGKNNYLYGKSKANFDARCQNPVIGKSSTTISTTKQPDSKQANILAPDQKKKSTPQVPTKLEQVRDKETDPIFQNVNISWSLFILILVGFVCFNSFKKKLPQIKGKRGEVYVKNGLKKHLDKTSYTIINNVTLPLEDGGTTQIDHIVVSNFGIFVIETKNMKGWIFGSEAQAKWTQTIHRSKYFFQNPLRQNYKHTKTLALLLNMPHEKFHSLVIFTKNADLKTKMPENVGHLKNALFFIKRFDQKVFETSATTEIISFIESCRLTENNTTDKNHIEYLREKHSNGSTDQKNWMI